MTEFNPKQFKPKIFKPGTKIQYDSTTAEWFKRHPGARTTVAPCEKCGLWYKPDLGHKCEVNTDENLG